MKTMRIGSSIIHLNQMFDLNCIACNAGTIVFIEYPTATKEYFVPEFFDPEMVALAIEKGIRESEDFDLLAKLRALDRIWEGSNIRGVRPE